LQGEEEAVGVARVAKSDTKNEEGRRRKKKYIECFIKTVYYYPSSRLDQERRVNSEGRRAAARSTG
jgi:hypothetical protein